MIKKNYFKKLLTKFLVFLLKGIPYAISEYGM